MAINPISGNSSVYTIYESMFKNNMSLFNNKLDLSKLFPAQNKDKTDPLSSSAMKYVTGIKSSASSLNKTLGTLAGGSAFSSKAMVSSDKEALSVNYSGNLFSKPGETKVKIIQLADDKGQEAIYSINGGPEQKSKSNTVDLGNGLNVTFKKASDDEITISQGVDLERAKSSVKDLVMNYNDIYIAALKNSDDPKAENLASKMLSISKTYSGGLANIGIGFDSDGKMTIDEKQLDKAAQDGSLEKFFTQNAGKNYGFTNQLSKLATGITNNTSNYVTKSIFGNNLMQNFSYNSIGSMLSYNYMNSGWLLDFLY
ncbi:MAG: hypothetical protein FWG48_05715 [Oscillospiraceae bacterium]|jgi:flagellar capping protein FliD|nr:hypothetical protein [Oscillospiraceae bacterium]